jgi:glutaredoxin
MKSVVMYTRDGCGLCEKAREVMLAERERTPFDLREIDVEGDDQLEMDYGIRLPVVLVDGVERFEISVEPEAFARALAD